MTGAAKPVNADDFEWHEVGDIIIKRDTDAPRSLARWYYEVCVHRCGYAQECIGGWTTWRWQAWIVARVTRWTEARRKAHR